VRSDSKFSKKVMEWQKHEDRGFIPNTSRMGDFKSRAAVSFSGHERDHLFVNDRGGKLFTDVAGVSGIDSDSDGRAGAFFDYDRDGYLDIAVTSNNAPLLQLFRNNLGDERRSGGRDDGKFIAFRFVGGSRSAAPATGLSNRDGFGARVLVHLADGAVLLRETYCGEGFAAQNSRTLHVGIGANASAAKIVVRWPSGKTQELSAVAAGQIVTAYEDVAESPDGTGFECAPYRPNSAAAGSAPPTAGAARLDVVARAGSPPGAGGALPLQVATTMATWCAACKENMPRVETLKKAFAPGEVEFRGLPVDPEDTPEKLRSYAEREKPAYEILADLSAEDKAAVKRAVIGGLDWEPLPTTIVTDRAGNILFVTEGVPNVSEVRRLVRRYQSR
jgi:thiol-disulfide isomerase/thioredoxin